ncbi:MAG: nucleoside recognition domain-containing protein [Planctomycetota bacterium]|nr:nucleoside recognition domain-containing protein [Planctomycetota bacterium]
MTILVLPLVSCGARLPVFALLIPAFFPTDWRGTILLGVYLFGILLAVVVAKILRTTTFSGEDTPFIMELPPYRAPTLRALSVHCWDRSKEYLKKAGTFILIISVLIWALGNFPTPSEEDTRGMSENQQAAYELEYSALGRIGRTIEPVTAPIGFDWKLNTALLGATAAKEVFVAQTAIVFSLGEQDEESLTLRKKLSDNYTPLTGIALILFLLIATPCGATVAVVARESGSWKWAILQWVGLTVMGYLFALAAFQLGGLFY